MYVLDGGMKKMQPIVVLFVRHGQAVSDPVVYDTDEDRPLTSAGEVAAARIASQIVLFAPQALFCSNSLRAHQTATFISKETGLVPEEVEGLRERAFRSLVGLTQEQIARQFGPHVLHAVLHGSEKVELPGEETLVQAKTRVRSAILHILSRPYHRVVLVSHGGPHGWLLEEELGLQERHTRIFRLDEASFSAFEFRREDGHVKLDRILTLNTQHLPKRLILAKPTVAES